MTYRDENGRPLTQREIDRMRKRWNEGDARRAAEAVREAKKAAKKRSKKATKKPSKKVIDEIFPGFSERSDRGRSANLRGKSYERAIANVLKKQFPKARRGIGQQREGYEIPDVIGTPFWIECAKGATNAIHDKLRQGLDASKKSPNEEYGGAPVVVFSSHDRSGLHMATMTRDQFMWLLARAYGRK